MFSVKTEISLKLYTYPKYERFVEYGFKTEDDAAKAMSNYLKRNTATDMIAFDKFGTEVRSKKITYMQEFESVVALKLEADESNVIESEKKIFENKASSARIG